MAEMTMIEAIRLALARAMADDADVVVLGEDVGINGGVFRATEGLQERFGTERVLDTPLAEVLIGGLCVGMAAQGLKIFLHTRTIKQLLRNFVHGETLGVHERHVKESQIFRGKLLVVTDCNRFLRKDQRDGVIGKTAWIVAEQISGELVQHNDLRQTTLWCFPPLEQLAMYGGGVRLTKAGGDGFIDLGKRVEPLFWRQFFVPKG